MKKKKKQKLKKGMILLSYRKSFDVDDDDDDNDNNNNEEKNLLTLSYMENVNLWMYNCYWGFSLSLFPFWSRLKFAWVMYLPKISGMLYTKYSTAKNFVSQLVQVKLESNILTSLNAFVTLTVVTKDKWKSFAGTQLILGIGIRLFECF